MKKTVLILLVTLAGCGDSIYTREVALQQDKPFPMGIKPEGVIVPNKRKMGPPPPGYFRIVGGSVPGWEPGGFSTRDNPMAWTFLGPKPIGDEYWSGIANAGGRVIGVAPHPTVANTCYIAAASGGVWKTTNGGTTWIPLTDELPTTNSGAIAIDPDNPSRVYYATGEWQQGSDGAGIFKSTDNGTNWTQIATDQEVGEQISSMVVSPNNASVIHVSGSGGTYRTNNGGSSWSLRMAGNASCLRVNNSDPNTVYVGRVQQGMYRSTDGGGTYTKLTTGLPASGFSRIVFDISKSNPDVLYAAFISSGGSLVGLYRTADGGDTWTKKSATPNFCTPQGWYDAYVGVDPENENSVFCGGVDPRYTPAGVIRTSNGGNSWTEVSNGPIDGQLHPDHHAIAWGPTGIIWEVNDGGVWTSNNNGDTWVNRNATLGAAQLYHVALDRNNENRMLGGTQDNGTPGRETDSTTWPQTQTGDGGFSAYDFNSSHRFYTTYVYADTYRWTNGVDEYISGNWGSDPTNWISPLIMDPDTSSTLYMGTNRVWRTVNATASNPTWTAISTGTVSGGGTLNAIAPAPSSSVIYTGSSTGAVYVTTNNGSSWSNRTSGLPGGSVGDVIVNPADSSEAFVCFFNWSGPRICAHSTRA